MADVFSYAYIYLVSCKWPKLAVPLLYGVGVIGFVFSMVVGCMCVCVTGLCYIYVSVEGGVGWGVLDLLKM